MLRTIGLIAALVALPAWTQAEEARSYTRESTTIFDGKAGKVMGSLPPGTPVAVLAKGGKRVKVAIDGWSQQYHELQIFSDWEDRIERVTLARMKPELRKVGSEKVDEWGTAWNQIQLQGWVDRSALTKDVATVWKSAVELYESRCYDCHEYRPPELLTPSQWRGTLIIMSHNAALTPEETALLRAYFQTHARRD